MSKGFAKSTGRVAQTIRFPMPLWEYRGKLGRRKTRFALDNAATIFPATLSRVQHHLYALRMTMNEPVDRDALQKALDQTIARFPTIAARLSNGFFWYHLEPVKESPVVVQGPIPLLRPMSRADLRKSCLRVQCDGNIVNVEYFHAICDGSGAMVFLKSLMAEYVQLRHNVNVPNERGILDRREAPRAVELEDCYPKNSSPVTAKYKGKRVYHLAGTPGQGLSRQIMTVDVSCALAAAKKKGVSLTEFLAAALLLAIDRMQREKCSRRKQRPVQITIPVNLRRMYPSETLRNFSLCNTVGIDPMQGEWSFEEVCTRIHHQMAIQNTPKEMGAKIANNVRLVKIAAWSCWPLMTKNLIMQLAYRMCGSNLSCMSLSNLGVLDLPDVMKPYVRSMDCTMDANAYDTNSCAVMSYEGKLYITFCRSVRETMLEEYFQQALLDQGVTVMEVSSSSNP